MTRKKTLSEVIADFQAAHGDRYDYSKVVYVNAHTKVIIGCREHGDFEQTPHSHRKGSGCPKCSGTAKKTQSEVIADFQAAHGSRYDYSKVVYVNAKTKVVIGCPEHGDFEQLTNDHRRGRGCPRCFGMGKTHAEHIAEFQAVHGDRYDYSKVVYVNNSTKVIIDCPEHGGFEQLPSHHKLGHGCPKCAGLKREQHEHVADFQSVHGDRYDYSKVVYVNTGTKVVISCEIHGDFEQTPHSHKSGYGCPKCSTHNRGEGIVYLVEITKSGGESFMKVGWTARGVEQRFKDDDFTVTLLDFATFENATAGEAFEKSIHAALSHHKYIPTEKFAGWTECFDINAKDDIVREFNLAIEQNKTCPAGG